jgi:antitoxin component YwqK of YwqJK toxin-antitoxin module
MIDLKPLRVTLPVVIATVACLLLAACSSTGTTTQKQPGEPAPQRESNPAPEPSPEPPPPVIEEFAAEHDKSRAPLVPKSVEVPLEHTTLKLPADSAQQFFESLEAKWEVSKTANRGESASGLHRYDEFRWGSYLPLCICESRSVDDWKYGHGRAVFTFDLTAKDSLLADWSLNGRRTLAIGYLRFGKMHGPWMFRNVQQAMKGEEGPLHFICEYVSGVAHGECRWYTPEGEPKGRSYYKGGKQEDEQLERVADGVTMRVFSGGVERGLYRKWNNEGQLVARAMAYNGRMWGKAEFWNPGDTRYYRVRYFKPGTDSHWEACYDKDGQLLDQRWIENNTYTGPFIEYHPGSFIKATGNLKNGQYDGVVYFKFKNRAANESAAIYKDGKREGGYWEYFESGKLKVQANYKNDELDGPYKIYFESGKLNGEGSYRNGLLEGPYKLYAEDGTLISETVYENGEIFDPAKQWPAPTVALDANGKPIKRTYGRWRAETHEEGKADTPSAVVGMAMAYHEKLGGVVMFGGRSGADDNAPKLNETWLRKDGKWQRVFADGTTPVARDYAAMAYDSARGVVVLFGGRREGRVVMLDTWELSETGWKRLEPRVTPDARCLASLVYDSKRQVCVLVGGLGVNAENKAQTKSSTWEWNGTQWSDAGAGPAGYGLSAAYDEQRDAVVVHGGFADRTNALKPRTWVRQGDTRRWTESKIGSGIVFGDLLMYGMVYDPDARSVVMFRQHTNFKDLRTDLRACRPTGEGWYFWSDERETHNPLDRNGFGAAYDRGRREIVIYGGRTSTGREFRETLVLTDETREDRAADTAEFAQAHLQAPGWSLIDNGDFAATEFYHAVLVHDTRRGVAVMLGQYFGESTTVETFEFSDGKWTHMQPQNAPSIRGTYASWYDEQSGTVKLYGGMQQGKSLSDLWEWDGRNWRCILNQAPGAPVVTSLTGWAWDPGRRVLVALAESGETRVVHEFDGQAWKNTGVSQPTGSSGQVVYDPTAAKVLVAYPMDTETFDSTDLAWHWDGTSWTESTIVKGDSPLAVDLHPDLQGKALWQVQADSIRRWDGRQWQHWRYPPGLNIDGGHLWVDGKTGRLHYHGTGVIGVKRRNDTLVFDITRGDDITPRPAWPVPTPALDDNGNPIHRKYGRWRVETQEVMPPAEIGMAMASHEALGGVVLFGGRKREGAASAALNETWLRKDGKWQRIFADGAAPPARDYAAMAYDSGRGVIVMYGGRDLRGKPHFDVWELDAAGWKRCMPANYSLEARAAASLVYDSHRKVCVLIGGLGLTKTGLLDLRSEVLEWNGKDWARASDKGGSVKGTAAVAGPALYGAAAAYDEQRRCIVVHGGQVDTNTASKQTWVLQDGTWIKDSIESGVEVSFHAAVYDADARSVVLLQSESKQLQALIPEYHTWGSFWYSAGPLKNPSERREFAAAYDRLTREIVVFGGAIPDGKGGVTVFRESLVLTDETDGDRAADTADFIRMDSAAPGWSVLDNGNFAGDSTQWYGRAYDAKRGVMVLFGGSTKLGFVADTREFKDGAWTLMRPEHAPEAREKPVCWYDESRGRVMLYGGNTLDKEFTDLWEWDGTDWKRLHNKVPGAPEAKGLQHHAWDPVRGVLVALVYKKDGCTIWEFDGKRWNDTGISLPDGHSSSKLVYDPTQGQVLCYCAIPGGTWFPSAKAWHWDGKNFTEAKAISSGPDAAEGYTLHADMHGKALWQVTGLLLRKFDGKAWQTWKCPAGVNLNCGFLWSEPGDSRIRFHGSTRDVFIPRNDTLVFDPEQGEQVK